MGEKLIFVCGYGNPGRQDDGLGPLIAEKISGLQLEGIVTDSDYQLNIEDAYDIAHYEAVVFVDASLNGNEPYVFSEVLPANEIRFTSHTLPPSSLISLCEDLYGTTPEAYIMAVRGYSFEFNEPMTENAERNMEKALLFLTEKLLEIRTNVRAKSKHEIV